MSGPIAAAVVGGIVGMAATQLMAPKPQAPQAPAAPTAPPESQVAKMPDVQGVRNQQAGAGQGGGAPGVAQTFLTGSTGVDQSSLQLGKQTLLGA